MKGLRNVNVLLDFTMPVYWELFAYRVSPEPGNLFAEMWSALKCVGIIRRLFRVAPRTMTAFA